MQLAQIFRFNWSRRLLKTSATAILLVVLSVGLSGAWWDFGGDENGDQTTRESTLPQGQAITDPTSLLRYALPIDNEPVREFQKDIEDIAFQLRSTRWGAMSQDARDANRVLSNRSSDILAGVPEEGKPQAEALIPQMEDKLSQLREAISSQDKSQVWIKRRELLNQLDRIEEMMVEEFPYEVPAEYADLPQLKGRSTVEVETTQGNLDIVVDGYSAPVTAGNFVDLVERGFYDGLEFIRAEDFVLQTGDPPGSEEGFIDPKTGEYRSVPMEVLVRGDSKPTYGVTLEEAGRYRAQPMLPFSANGAVAMARPGIDPNGGSSQFFFFKYDSELTPPGFNVMDGRYAVFGYVVEGGEILADLSEDDKIVSAQVVEGKENLVEPQVAQAS
ncbi:MAG: peptidylprolyl isomerase [Cyanobacteria bacterium SW_5_48_44]|nr:MAG: peptidylprolyl isomerase [Cyanobacteria bacterium SW_5_48_44]